jgi:SAM-dependent methyltransferase
MEVPCFVSPTTGLALRRDGEALVADDGSRFPIINGIPRFCEIDNYAASFGRQWNQFQTTQIDGEGIAASPSAVRLFAETSWKAEELAGLDILEAGSGAGRFSRALLEHTQANLYSIDYSSAVEANWRNNQALAKGRFHLAQASIYEMPFPDGRFDKVLCLGVLQHTPDFEAAVHALIRKARPGGEIVVDFYPIRGWWTKMHAKYLLRPITRHLSQARLLRLIERHADRLMRLSNGLDRLGMGVLRRFVPIVDFKHAMPAGLTREQLREWVVLDTFDMFSPQFDKPQRIEDVAKMFEGGGAVVRFAGYVDSCAGQAAVVRAVKR